MTKDWKDYFRNFGISLIVWSCIPVLFWVTTLIFDFKMDPDGRIGTIAALVFSVLMFVPSKVYGKANLPREGVSFASLPATNAEKFFSMLIYCSVVTPILVGLGSWAIDTLLALLPFGGFNGLVALPKSELGMLLVTIACSVLMFSSIFVFGNMIFKRRKAGKTIAWTMLIVFVGTMILQLCHFWEAFELWNIDPITFIWINDAIMFVFAVVFFYLTYRKIKNQKY